MYITRIKAKNFVTYESLDIQLPHSGLIGVEGTNLDNPVMVGNAVGKTVFFDMITYAIFGEIIRKRRANVVGRFAETMYLYVEFITASGKPITITRKKTRGGAERIGFNADGKHHKGTATIIQPLITHYFGIGWLTAKNCIVYGDSDERFITTGDKGRKEILAEMANVLYLRKAKSIASRERPQWEAKRNQYDGKCEAIKGNLDALTATIKTRTAQVKNYDEVVKRKVAPLVLRKNKLAVKSRGTVQLVHEIAKIQNDLLMAQIQRDKAPVVSLSMLNDATEKVQQETLELSRLINTREDYEKRLQLFRSTGKCPTCFTESVNIDEHQIQTLIQHCDLAASVQKTKVKKATTRLSELNSLADAVASLFTKVDKLTINLRDAQAKLQSKQNASLEVKALNSEIKAIRAEQLALAETLNNVVVAASHAKILLFKNRALSRNAKRHVDAIDFWIERFGQRGLEAEFVEDLVNNLNVYVSDYIATLTDGNIAIEIVPYLKTKKGHKHEIQINITENGITKPYALYSGGQRNRIDKAISLGLMKLAGPNVSFKLFDEIGRNLPPKGYERIVQLMKDIFDGQQVFLITHEQEMRKYFDYKLMVKLEHGRSTIERI